MSESSKKKRLFFGAEVQAPWPERMPESGRFLDPDHRHMTLAFLGDASWEDLKEILSCCPINELKIGIAGKFSKVVFFPSEKYQRVAAWEVEILEKVQIFMEIQERLCSWLEENNFSVDKRKFHPHVTMARGKVDQEEWKSLFEPIPLVVTSIHLYESLGRSQYKSLWHYPLLWPFEEIEHTADLAFLVRGKSPEEVHLHAQLALTFSFPELLPFVELDSLSEDLDDIVIQLNDLVTRSDQEIGCPIKAVSFHGEVKKIQEEIYQWEMIIDV
ncbi:MAG: hypothetical protein Tsb0015_06780 [Simkaniaceae bacterium]